MPPTCSLCVGVSIPMPMPTLSRKLTLVSDTIACSTSLTFKLIVAPFLQFKAVPPNGPCNSA